MLTQLLILFFSGLALCLLAYFLPLPKGWKITLNILGGILIALPFVLLIYFMTIILAS